MSAELIGGALLVVGVVVTLTAWIKHHKLRQVINKIPGSGGLPFIGDSLTISSDDLGFFNQVRDYCRENHDKGIVKFWMGPEPMIWVFRANTVEALLNSSKHMVKSFTYRFLRPWLGDGLLLSKYYTVATWKSLAISLSTSDKWFERRRLITPTFHFKILEQFVGIFNENAAILVRLLDAKADGPAFDFQPFIYRCMLDNICETAMGVKVQAQEHSDSKFVRALYRESELIMYRMKYPWLWPERLFRLLPTGREDTDCLTTLHQFTKQVIRDRKKELKTCQQQQQTESSGTENKMADDDDSIYTGSRKRRLAFVDMLLSNESLSEQDIMEEVDTFMFEGHDTTASGMIWILYMLACYPEFQAKLQHEVDSVLGDDDVTSEDVNKLKYAECFIKETFRLYPPVVWFGRTTTEPCTIGGYDIPKGVGVFFFNYELHRDPARFPDPEKFDPDRWTTDEIASRHPYCYIPFSAGTRNCVGQRFALLELKVTLCHLMRKYTITCSYTRDEIVPMATLIFKPAKAMPLQFKRRVH